MSPITSAVRSRTGAPRTAGCGPATAHRAGPGRIPLRLADRYFLAAHTGTDRLVPRVDPALVALGCAGGLLAELLLEDEIGVDPAVHPRGPGMPPDFLAWSVLREVRAAPDHDVRTWVRHLAPGAAQKVRARLTIIDVLREVPPGRFRGAGCRRVPGPDRPADDVRELFRRAETTAPGTGMITVPAVQAEVCLAVLAAATGVAARLGLPRAEARPAAGRAEQWRDRLPAGLRAVVGEVAAAQAQCALTPRR